jgi:hypothetical protein
LCNPQWTKVEKQKEKLFVVKKKKKNKILVGFGHEGYELDASKLTGTETVKGNAANVVARCEELLARLINTTEHLPSELAHVCWLLSQAVGEKMPKARYVAIGGFIMLRFILPGACSRLLNFYCWLVFYFVCQSVGDRFDGPVARACRASSRPCSDIKGLQK